MFFDPRCPEVVRAAADGQHQDIVGQGSERRERSVVQIVDRVKLHHAPVPIDAREPPKAEIVAISMRMLEQADFLVASFCSDSIFMQRGFPQVSQVFVDKRDFGDFFPAERSA